MAKIYYYTHDCSSAWMDAYIFNTQRPACMPIFLKKYVYNKIKILAYKQAGLVKSQHKVRKSAHNDNHFYLEG